MTLPRDLFQELRDAAAEANPTVARIADDVAAQARSPGSPSTATGVSTGASCALEGAGG